MKRIPATVLLAILTLIGSREALSGVITGPFVPDSGSWTLVPNGGFETGDLASWSDVNCNTHLGTFSAMSDSVYPAARGDWSAQSSPIPTDGSGPGFCRWQGPFVLDTSKTYVLSGFFNTLELDSPKIYAQLVNSDLSYTAANAGGNELALGEDAWQFAWTEFQPTQSTLYLRIIHDQNFDNGKHGYFDEFAITEQGDFQVPAAVPEPSSLSLAIVGTMSLLGYGWRRRKRKQVT